MRMEKFAHARLMSRLVRPLVSEEHQEFLALALAEYGEELFQLRYNSNYESVVARRVKERLSMDTEYSRILEQVNAMTVDDMELETPNAR